MPMMVRGVLDGGHVGSFKRASPCQWVADRPSGGYVVSMITSQFMPHSRLEVPEFPHVRARPLGTMAVAAEAPMPLGQATLPSGELDCPRIWNRHDSDRRRLVVGRDLLAILGVLSGAPLAWLVA